MNLKMTPEKKQAFLDTLARTGDVEKACDAISISRDTAYAWRRTNPSFAEAWEDARKDAGQTLEDVLFKLAKGYTEITLKDGKEVPVVTKPNGKMLMYYLAANMPEKYGTGKAKKPQNISLQVVTGIDRKNRPQVDISDIA